MIENVKFSIVLRRKTKLQASFRDKHNVWEYVCVCVCVCGGGGGVKRNKTQTIITGYHLNPNQKQ